MNRDGTSDVVEVRFERYDEYTGCRTDFQRAWGFGAYRIEALRSRPDELVWVFEGVMTAHVGSRRWPLTPQHALWLPAGTVGDVIPNRRSRACCLLLDAPARPPGWTEPTPVEVTPILGELIHHLCAPRLSDGAAHRAHALLYDLLRPVDGPGLQVPLPRDPRALAIADALLTDPGDTRTLDGWAESVYTSAKTLQRLFAAETGLRFPEWRTQARLYAALPRLAEGCPVGQVAHEVGYAGANGFIEAFHRHYGHTPGAHFAARR